MHTKQQTLEISCFHLIKQDRPGYDRRCSYARGCAAAPLFKPGTDLAALDDFEARVDAKEIRAHLDGHDLRLTLALQDAHDETAGSISHSNTHWRRAWLVEAQAVASEYGLDFAPILEAAREAGWEVDA